MRKWFPIPKGGVLYSNEDVLSLFNGINYETDTDNRRSYGMVLKDLFLNQGIDCNSEYRRIFVECEEKLDQQEKIYMLSDFSRFIASCVDVDELRESRIQNYQQLKTALYNMGVIPAVLLEDDECPFVLPIQINERDSFRSYLMNNQIYCAVHWPSMEFGEN